MLALMPCLLSPQAHINASDTSSGRLSNMWCLTTNQVLDEKMPRLTPEVRRWVAFKPLATTAHVECIDSGPSWRCTVMIKILFPEMVDNNMLSIL